MEKILKALWEIFLDHSRGANERAIKRHNEEVEAFYDPVCANGKMSRVVAENLKEANKL